MVFDFELSSRPIKVFEVHSLNEALQQQFYLSHLELKFDAHIREVASSTSWVAVDPQQRNPRRVYDARTLQIGAIATYRENYIVIFKVSFIQINFFPDSTGQSRFLCLFIKVFNYLVMDLHGFLPIKNL